LRLQRPHHQGGAQQQVDDSRGSAGKEPGAVRCQGGTVRLPAQCNPAGEPPHSGNPWSDYGNFLAHGSQQDGGGRQQDQQHPCRAAAGTDVAGNDQQGKSQEQYLPGFALGEGVIVFHDGRRQGKQQAAQPRLQAAGAGIQQEPHQAEDGQRKEEGIPQEKPEGLGASQPVHQCECQPVHRAKAGIVGIEGESPLPPKDLLGGDD